MPVSLGARSPRAGVLSAESFDPDPYLAILDRDGIPPRHDRHRAGPRIRLAGALQCHVSMARDGVCQPDNGAGLLCQDRRMSRTMLTSAIQAGNTYTVVVGTVTFTNSKTPTA